MDTLIYAPVLDDRFGQAKVTPRLGIQADAQFLTKQHVLQSGLIVDHCHLPVLAYGIRTDFQGEAFPGSQYLLAWADE